MATWPYGRTDWLGDLVDRAERERLDPVVAWGSPMPLDTSYRARPSSPSRHQSWLSLARR